MAWTMRTLLIWIIILVVNIVLFVVIITEMVYQRVAANNSKWYCMKMYLNANYSTLDKVLYNIPINHFGYNRAELDEFIDRS